MLQNAPSNIQFSEMQLSNRKYWWVNQNQTYQSEVSGGFLWSPKTRSDGARNQFYENMKDVKVGDIIFSFCNTRIKAIGIALGTAETFTKPNFGNAGHNWSQDGWFVPVKFIEIEQQIRPKDHIERIRDHLPGKYAPLQNSGDGLQSVYLANVPPKMAAVLGEIIGAEYVETLKLLSSYELEVINSENSEEKVILDRTDIRPTTKAQLVNSRRGQGVFKTKVSLIEKKCRITGVTDQRHLRASHIKPWKDSSDDEKLSGYNGLLLAPHIDHLFDRGFISFSGDGELRISKQLDKSILKQWNIAQKCNVGKFIPEQIVFLDYHYHHVFKKD